MRTPKFNENDVALIQVELSLSGNDAATVARKCGTSYVTILKIKKGTYVPRTDDRSGLQWEPEATPAP